MPATTEWNGIGKGKRQLLPFPVVFYRVVMVAGPYCLKGKIRKKGKICKLRRSVGKEHFVPPLLLLLTPSAWVGLQSLQPVQGRSTPFLNRPWYSKLESVPLTARPFHNLPNSGLMSARSFLETDLLLFAICHFSILDWLSSP